MFENLYFKNTLRFVVLVILFTMIGVMKGKAMNQAEVDDHLDNALRSYKNSIEQGEDAGGKSLGQSQYYIGLEHLKENVERALEWFQKAETNGCLEARKEVGKILYDFGIQQLNDAVFPYEYFEALHLFMKAFERRHVDAALRIADVYFQLGHTYRKGQHVPKDLLKALKFFKLAAERNFSEAQDEIHNEILTTQFMIGVKHYEDQNFYMALEAFEKAALNGHILSTYNVAEMFRGGVGCTKNERRALAYFMQVAEKGGDKEKAEVLSALYNIGTIYSNGGAVPRNFSKAREWFKKAKRKGHPKARNAIGRVYVNMAAENQEKRNISEVIRCLEKAMKKGNQEAQLALPQIYLERGAEFYKAEKYVEAMNDFTKSAEGGCHEAQFNIGVMYNQGQGVGKDEDEALQWFQKAADHGNTEAENLLKLLKKVKN